MSDDKNRPAQGVPGAKPDTTILHLDKLAAGAAHGGSDDESVTTFIAKAAAETIQESAVPVVVPKEAGTLPAESMLGAVSYCYSKGVYSSKEIGRKMAQDPVFRASCQNSVPRPEDIRRFRRLNREAILRTLEKALRFARKKVADAWSPANPFRAGDSSSPSTPMRPVAMSAEETQVFVRREASERVNQATFIDGMSM